MKNDLSYQPQCGRCHRAGTAGQATLEVIGSKWSYTLNWCKANNDNDDNNNNNNNTQTISNAL